MARCLYCACGPNPHDADKMHLWHRLSVVSRCNHHAGANEHGGEGDEEQSQTPPPTAAGVHMSMEAGGQGRSVQSLLQIVDIANLPLSTLPALPPSITLRDDFLPNSMRPAGSFLCLNTQDV